MRHITKELVSRKDLEVSKSCVVLHFLVVFLSLAPSKLLDTAAIIKSETKKYDLTCRLSQLKAFDDISTYIYMCDK